MPDGKRAFPLWEQTKQKYVYDMWKAQALLVRYRRKRNPRDLEDFSDQLLTCWMNIRSYREMLAKKLPANTIDKIEGLFNEDEPGFKELEEIWKLLSDAYKKLGIDDVSKMEDEDAWKYAGIEGLFDVD